MTDFKYGDWEESEDGGTHFQRNVDEVDGSLGDIIRYHAAGSGLPGCIFCKDNPND